MMSNDLVAKLPEEVKQFFENNPEYFERVTPTLINPIQVDPEYVPESVYFIFDSIVCGVMKSDGTEIIYVPGENPEAFEIQFDDEPVYLSVGKHLVINRINDIAEFEDAFASALP